MKPPTDPFLHLRALARIVRREPPERFDLCGHSNAENGEPRCALGVAVEHKLYSVCHLLTESDIEYLFNTDFHERRRIKPISWYSRVMRFIKQREKELSHAKD